MTQANIFRATAICGVCHRTDALKPGKVDHDEKWHEGVEEYHRKKLLDERARRSRQQTQLAAKRGTVA